MRNTRYSDACKGELSASKIAGCISTIDISIGPSTVHVVLKLGRRNYKVLEFKKGAQARQIEQQILSWFRNEKFLGPAYRTGDGWTETVSAKKISLQKIWRKVTELSRDKGKLVRKTHFK